MILFFNVSLLLYFYCFLFFEGFVFYALAVVARILEVLHKSETQRVYKGTQARHSDVERMPHKDNQSKAYPSEHQTYSLLSIDYHQGKAVKGLSQHSTCQA